MGLLHWETRYSVGIAAVDHEHRELIDLVNRLYDEATSKGSKEAVLDFFGDLFKAISSHFALEERLMREREYDHLVQHKPIMSASWTKSATSCRILRPAPASTISCSHSGSMRGFPGTSRPMTRGCTCDRDASRVRNEL